MAGILRSRRRGRRRDPRPWQVWVAGLVTTGLIVGFIWLAENAYNGLPLLNYRTVYVSLPNIGHLQRHDPVDIAGVRVGQVLSTATAHDHALVKLQLQGVGPIPVDSSVIVRAEGLLGERYVQLTPGSSHRALPDGGTLRAGPGSFYNGLPEALNLFDPSTRRAMGYMLNGLGEGFDGRGSQLNQAIHVGAASGANFDQMAEAILARPGAAAAFLPDANAGMSALNASRNQLDAMFAPTATAFQPFIDERAPVDHALNELPATETDGIDSGLGLSGERLLASLGSVLTAAAPVSPELPGAFRQATGLLKVGDGQTPTPVNGSSIAPLVRVKSVLDQVPAAVPSTLAILRSLQPDLAPLKQDFTNLVGPVTSLAEHGCDIQSFATNVASLVGVGTLPGGHFGPDGGFPVSVAISPAEANNDFGTPFHYPVDRQYYPPCAFSPGDTIPGSTMLQVMAGVFR